MILYFPRVWPLKSNGADVMLTTDAGRRSGRVTRVASIARMTDNPRVMLPRFLRCRDLDPGRRSRAMLPADEARHLTRVLRLGVGRRGRGVRRPRPRVPRAGHVGCAAERSRSAARSRSRRRRKRAVPLTLVQAVLKGEQMDDVVRDATMMGVAAIVPVVTAHTVAVKAEALERGKRLNAGAGWRCASAKQCRRATLPVVARAVDRSGTGFRPATTAARLLFVEPSAGAGASRRCASGCIDPAPRSAGRHCRAGGRLGRRGDRGCGPCRMRPGHAGRPDASSGCRAARRAVASAALSRGTGVSE